MQSAQPGLAVTSILVCPPARELRLTQVEGGVPLAGKVVDVGDAEGLDGHAADAQQCLGHKHHQQHLVVLPGGVRGAAAITEVGPGPRGPALAQVCAVVEGACGDKGTALRSLVWTKNIFI